MVSRPFAPKIKNPGMNSMNMFDILVQASMSSTAYPATAIPRLVQKTCTVDRNFRIRGYSSIMDMICTAPPKVLNRV